MNYWEQENFYRQIEDKIYYQEVRRSKLPEFYPPDDLESEFKPLVIPLDSDQV